jgi:hypothetical protein
MVLKLDKVRINELPKYIDYSMTIVAGRKLFDIANRLFMGAFDYGGRTGKMPILQDSLLPYSLTPYSLLPILQFVALLPRHFPDY